MSISVPPKSSAVDSDQILRGMHKVLAHDLPNQMVVLQSLLQLLDQEESARLSGDGREYVRRLQNATRRAGDMARFLKEMERVRSFTTRPETIALAGLACELQGELQRRRPAWRFEFDWQWSMPAIVGDPRVFLQALPELCTGLLHPQANGCRLTASAQKSGAAIELTFELVEPRPTSPRLTIEALDQRMEIILARAWLARCGAGVVLTLPPSGVRFCITVPGPGS